MVCLSSSDSQLDICILIFLFHSLISILLPLLGTEPTVGSDPVLGNCIWNYLHQCCLENISIIIVTHYIEEATFGHVVGIMRNGTILEEGTPAQLTAKFGQKTLEDVFLYLCTVGNVPVVKSGEEVIAVENSREAVSAAIPVSTSSKTINSSQGNFTRNIFLNLWILSVLVRKNLTRFFQFNISFLIFLIPAFQALILCTLYNRDAVPVSLCNALQLLLKMNT